MPLFSFTLELWNSKATACPPTPTWSPCYMPSTWTRTTGPNPRHSNPNAFWTQTTRKWSNQRISSHSESDNACASETKWQRRNSFCSSHPCCTRLTSGFPSHTRSCPVWGDFLQSLLRPMPLRLNVRREMWLLWAMLFRIWLIITSWLMIAECTMVIEVKNEAVLIFWYSYFVNFS